MKLTVNKYLNARIGKASTDAPCQFYRSPGDTIELETVVVGTEIEGNSIWYKNNIDECFYWSGGVEEVVFAKACQPVNILDAAQAMNVLKEAKNYFWDYYRRIDSNINGIFIGDKNQNNNITATDFCLVFQVYEEIVDPAATNYIPEHLIFKGFKITTGILKVSIAKAQVASPGQSVSRIGDVGNWGTVSVKVAERNKRRPFTFLLTNYHVMASDLISQKTFDFNSKTTSLPNRRFLVPSQINQADGSTGIGAFHFGMLSSFMDVAMLMLDDNNFANNTFTNSGVSITGFLDVFGDNNFQGKLISRTGAASSVVDIKITSVNSNQLFSYDNGNHVQELRELIQLELCSEPGDSGSPVMIGNKIIGILVGADDNFSYAIPILRILNFFNLKIV